MTAKRSVGRTARTMVLACGLWLCPLAPLALAQPQLNPVYVDDAPAAVDTFSRVRDHLSAGNTDEAVRVLQALLDEHAERLTPSATDPDVFVSVRSRVHDVLLGNADLLDRYRALQSPRAAAILESATRSLNGPVNHVERTLLLTPAGLEAALRIAQRQFEDARFEAARITLEQLEHHPDRQSPGPAADDAAEMLTAVARWLDRPEVWERADRWAQQAGHTPPVHEQGAWPEMATRRGLWPLDRLPPIDPKGLIAKPLWNVDVRSAASTSLEPPMGLGRGAVNIPPQARQLTMLPTVTDDLLLINDGMVIKAWDRFTLAERWTVQPIPLGQANAGEDADAFRIRGWGAVSSIEPTSVTVKGRHGVASTGRNTGAGQNGDDRIHGIDPRSGRLRWSVRLGDLDPTLEGGSIHGPLEIEEGVVVAAVRRQASERRLLSLAMIGVDAEAGRLLWVRPVASAGWLPFGPQSVGPEATTVWRGVAYRGDELGAVAAISVDTGRTLWVRRMPVEAGTSMRDTARPWELSRPVPDGGSIIVISPDQRRIVRLDADDGRVLAERQSSQFGGQGPAYLLAAGGHLVAVGQANLALTPMAMFDSAPIRLTAPVDDPGIWGRVIVVGEKVLIPLINGLSLVDPSTPSGDPLVQPLDRPGNILAIGSQVVVVDDNRAHSYLQWEVAERILRDRMAAEPTDPTPAVTFAELAYRAGRPNQITPAVDAALRAIAHQPRTERNIEQRDRLFDAVHEMVGRALEGGDAPERPTSEGVVMPRLRDPAMLAGLVERLGRLATTPDEHVAVALSSGRLKENANDPSAAAAIYQQVLDDRALATANWRAPRVQVRAELEAARRLEALIAAHGPVIYQPQEAELGRQLAALGEHATGEALEALAMRFPLSARVPEIYQRIADLHEAAGRTREAIAALESGLKAAQRITSAPGATLGELAGRLVIKLQERQQAGAAATVLKNLRRRLPDVALTVNGEPLDVQRLDAELAERIAATMRWPRVGQLTPQNIEALTGWWLMRPALWEPTPNVTGGLVLQSQNEVGAWRIGADGRLEKAWSRPVSHGAVALVRKTADAAYVLFTGEKDGGLEKAPLAAGVSGWRTPALNELFPPGEETRGMRRVPGVMLDQFDTPDDGTVSSEDLLTAADDRTSVLVQRGGRCAAIDNETGEVLWQGDSGISQVYDVHLSDGTLVVAGDVKRTNAAGAIEEFQPAVQVIDARAGRPGQRLSGFGRFPEEPSPRVRWVRLTQSGQLICGTDSSVVSIDPVTTQRNWTITSEEMMPAVASWLIGDRLLLMGADRQLWLAGAASGQVRQDPLEAPRARLESSREIDAFAVSSNLDGPFAVVTHQGLMVFSPSGDLQGLDGLGAIDAMLPPRMAEGRTIAVETVSEGRQPDGLMEFQVHQWDSSTGMLAASPHTVLLGARPSVIELLDGKVAITAGATTIVLEAPFQPR